MAAGTARQVLIPGIAFPASLAVAEKAVVAFVHQDSVAHMVAADHGAFDVPLASGRSVRMAFSAAATCACHGEIAL